MSPMLSSFCSTVPFRLSKIQLTSALKSSLFAFFEVLGQFTFGLFCKGFFSFGDFPIWVGSINTPNSVSVLVLSSLATGSWYTANFGLPPVAGLHLTDLTYSLQGIVQCKVPDLTDRHFYFPWCIFRPLIDVIFSQPHGHTWSFLLGSFSVVTSCVVLAFSIFISFPMSLTMSSVIVSSYTPTPVDTSGILPLIFSVVNSRLLHILLLYWVPADSGS